MGKPKRYTKIFNNAFPAEDKRGRVNEKAEEGLRDYRCEQSVKKCASTYSLLERTYISRPDKKWCFALCILFLIH